MAITDQDKKISSMSEVTPSTDMFAPLVDLSQPNLANRNVRASLAAILALTPAPSFASITGKPTTLAGYGITDGITAAAVAAGYQPLDADLTAISALATTAYGRSFLTLADGSAARAYIGAGTGNGTVTSVNLTQPAAGITVSGGPITGSGSITLSLADDLAALEALSGTNTIYYRSGVSTWTAVTIGSNLTFAGGTLSATAGGTGTVTSLSSGDLSPLFTTNVASATTTPSLSFSLNSQNANLIFAGPTGGGAAAPTFRSLVSADIPDLSGTYQPLDGDLTAIAALSGTGYARRTGTSTWTTDTTIPWASISSTPTTLAGYGITDAQPLDDALTALSNEELLVNTSTPLQIVDQSSNVIGLIDSATSDGGLSGVAPQLFLGTNSPSTDNSAILIGRNLSGSRAGGSHGIRDESTYDASGAGLYGYASFDSIPTASGSANYNHIASFQSRIQYTGSGSLPNIQGLTYQTTHTGSGTIGQSIAVFVDDDLGTGPITSQIGVYFDQLSRGTNNFSIYSSGTQQSYHEGLWQVGSSVQVGASLLAFKSGQTDPGEIVAGTQHRTIGAAATSVIEQWDSFAAASAFIARRSNGTSASPTRLSSGDAIYSILARGRYDGGFSGTAAQLTFEADENWTASNIIGTRIRFLTAINGGGGVGERVRISGTGNLLVGTTSDTGLTGAGNIRASGSLMTGDPSGSTAQPFKVGSYTVDAVTSQTGVVRIDIGGVVYKFLVGA